MTVTVTTITTTMTMPDSTLTKTEGAAAAEVCMVRRCLFTAAVVAVATAVIGTADMRGVGTAAAAAASITPARPTRITSDNLTPGGNSKTGTGDAKAVAMVGGETAARTPRAITTCLPRLRISSAGVMTGTGWAIGMGGGTGGQTSRGATAATETGVIF